MPSVRRLAALSATGADARGVSAAVGAVADRPGGVISSAPHAGQISVSAGTAVRQRLQMISNESSLILSLLSRQPRERNAAGSVL
jgi:hypothetical protein